MPARYAGIGCNLHLDSDGLFRGFLEHCHTDKVANSFWGGILSLATDGNGSLAESVQLGEERTMARWGWWSLAFLMAARVAIAAFFPLMPEEAYHWDFSRHLDWSYYDHPPMIAWSIAIGRAVLG